MDAGETPPVSPGRWVLVEEFLALTEAVGALGASLAAQGQAPSSSFREALAASRKSLQSIEREIGETG
jgi:hypothetical protein